MWRRGWQLYGWDREGVGPLYGWNREGVGPLYGWDEGMEPFYGWYEGMGPQPVRLAGLGETLAWLAREPRLSWPAQWLPVRYDPSLSLWRWARPLSVQSPAYLLEDLSLILVWSFTLSSQSLTEVKQNLSSLPFQNNLRFCPQNLTQCWRAAWRFSTDECTGNASLHSRMAVGR